ncbi:hypothetical protein [Kocuria sp. SM24M-10]|uniref:hypothetical protein n=1 Tax=Kocuria sp. SM24M-10 TaxID=1660349 RepID=UPI00064B6FE9|nr:hypothetical protein [Kocuria sp. SM24M-10]KLU08494.1 hypothetical protein ABL57_17870 [Kocuria sp. SM24M-10]
MAGALITVTAGAGALAAAVGAAGLCGSIQAGHVMDPTAMAFLVAGVVLLAIGFVATFEHQSRLWAHQMDAQLQTRRRDLRSLGIIPGQSPQAH